MFATRSHKTRQLNSQRSNTHQSNSQRGSLLLSTTADRFILDQAPVIRVRPKSRVAIRTSPRRQPVVHAEKVSRSSTISANFVFAFCVFVLLLGKLFIRLEIMEKSYQVESVRNELLSEDAAYRELKAKKAMKANPRGLIKDSGSRLGLYATTPGQLRRVALK